jgi:hypothetical protein
MVGSLVREDTKSQLVWILMNVDHREIDRLIHDPDVRERFLEQLANAELPSDPAPGYVSRLLEVVLRPAAIKRLNEDSSYREEFIHRVVTFGSPSDAREVLHELLANRENNRRYLKQWEIIK